MVVKSYQTGEYQIMRNNELPQALLVEKPYVTCWEMDAVEKMAKKDQRKQLKSNYPVHFKVARHSAPLFN